MKFKDAIRKFFVTTRQSDVDVATLRDRVDALDAALRIATKEVEQLKDVVAILALMSPGLRVHVLNADDAIVSGSFSDKGPDGRLLN